MDILTDKEAGEPIYRQIIKEIKNGIECGIYKYGQKLPPERELSLSLGVSRGTVKKAYEELERTGILKIVWGSGAFIAKRTETGPLAEEDSIFKTLMRRMEEKGFSQKEREFYVNLALRGETWQNQAESIIIDCNPEAAAIFEKQLSKIPGLGTTTLLLEDLVRFSNRTALFCRFPFIFTTTSHYDEIKSLLPGLEDRIMKAAVAPDRETIVNLLKTPKDMGLFVKSRRFRQIVGSNLAGLGIKIADKDIYYEKWADNDADGFDKFLSGKSHIIMPPPYAMELSGKIYGKILDFTGQGGKVTLFNYLIEKGSLMHIEDRVSNLIYNIKE